MDDYPIINLCNIKLPLQESRPKTDATIEDCNDTNTGGKNNETDATIKDGNGPNTGGENNGVSN